MLTYEEKLDFLKRYKDFVSIAEDTVKMMDELRAMQLPASPVLDGMPKNPNHEDRMAKFAVRMDELQRKYAYAFDNACEIIRAINDLEDGNERKVLVMYYLEREKIGDIAEQIGFCERHTKNIKKSGIEHLQIKKQGG